MSRVTLGYSYKEIKDFLLKEHPVVNSQRVLKYDICREVLGRSDEPNPRHLIVRARVVDGFQRKQWIFWGFPEDAAHELTLSKTTKKES